MTFPLRFHIDGVVKCRLDPAAPTLSSAPCHLASDVTRRRAGRGLSISQLSALSGLSTSTLDNIEHGRKTSYDPGTIASLEYALGWGPGSVERILKGMDAKPLQDPDLTAVIAAWPKLSPGSRRMLAILASEGARAEN